MLWEHQDRILALGNRLRRDGVDAIIDQYFQAPPEGWPRWMTRQLEVADFVILVCTHTYSQRLRMREEPGKGYGVLWETNFILNELYGAGTVSRRFVPIIMRSLDVANIPIPLRGLTFYSLDREEGYQDLYRFITGRPRVLMPSLGKLVALPDIAPKSFPASFVTMQQRQPTAKEQSQHLRSRLQMISRVRHDWIDGVLRRSLSRVARLELQLDIKELSQFVDPLSTVLSHPMRMYALCPLEVEFDLSSNKVQALS